MSCMDYHCRWVDLVGGTGWGPGTGGSGGSFHPPGACLQQVCSHALYLQQQWQDLWGVQGCQVLRQLWGEGTLCFLGVFFWGGGGGRGFAFPNYISGVHHFWVRFLRMWPFFNPTIKVVTFRLRGWCVLGVFVAGIHPSRTWTSGSFEPVRWNACVHRLDLSLYSHPKEFWGEWSLNPC